MNLAHDIKIRKAYRLGGGKQRPVLIALSNASDKATIYSNVRNLQDKKGTDDKYYRIEDQLLPHECEHRRKGREFKWRNSKRSTAEQVEISVLKGRMQVKGKDYVSPIVIPEAKKLIAFKQDEILELESVNVKKGIPVEKGSSTFTGYICDVQSFEEVNKAYEWVMYHNFDTRHIICACMVPGSNVVNSVAYEDHGEYGAGQRLLSYMLDAKLENRAIFVTRHYDGEHIGPKHYECIIKAVKSTVNQKPYNQVTETMQFSWGSNSRNTQTRVKNL